MCARRVTQPAAASFEPGASAPVRDECEQHPLRSGVALAAFQQPGHHGVDPQPAPQRVEYQGAADRSREEVNASCAGPALVEAVREVAGLSSRVSDATRPLDGVAVELVFAAEAVQDFRSRRFVTNVRGSGTGRSQRLPARPRAVRQCGHQPSGHERADGSCRPRAGRAGKHHRFHQAASRARAGQDGGPRTRRR